jgi:hypothetical protein
VVVVWNARVWDGERGETIVTPHKGTKEWIAMMKGDPVLRDNQDENPYCLTQKCSRG